LFVKIAHRNELFDGNPDEPVKEGMNDDHREDAHAAAGVRCAFIVEFGKVIDENSTEVGNLTNELGNIVALLPANISVSGGAPCGAVFNFLIEGIGQSQIQVFEDLGDMVFELTDGKLVGDRNAFVSEDMGHPIGHDAASAVGEKIREAAADDALLWSWIRRCWHFCLKSFLISRASLCGLHENGCRSAK
jgi:hypothetical protein